VDKISLTYCNILDNGLVIENILISIQFNPPRPAVQKTVPWIVLVAFERHSMFIANDIGIVNKSRGFSVLPLLLCILSNCFIENCKSDIIFMDQEFSSLSSFHAHRYA